MEHIVDMGKPGAIEFMPESTSAEIVQNLGIIIAVPQGSAPMCREIGTGTDSQGMQDTIGKAILTRDIFTAVQEQEPRVELNTVELSRNEDGENYTAVMEVEIIG